MKKLFFLFAFLGLVSLSANAQKCSSAKSAKATCMKSSKAAATAASLDEAIESRTCAKSGSVSYVKKVVNSETGAVSYQDVEFCTKSKKFVNVSPVANEKKMCTKGAKASMTAKGGKACCAKGAKASTVSMDGKASCSKGAKAACCAKGAKKAKASASTSSDAKVKMVKNEEN